MNKCGCENGENCTKITVCQMNDALQEQADEIKRLTAHCAGLENMDKVRRERIAKLERLHQRNVDDFKPYKCADHRCDWRVIAEAMSNRSREALE